MLPSFLLVFNPNFARLSKCHCEEPSGCEAKPKQTRSLSLTTEKYNGLTSQKLRFLAALGTSSAIPSLKARPGATWFEYAIASAALNACFSTTVSVQARSGPGIASLSLAMTGTVTLFKKSCEIWDY